MAIKVRLFLDGKQVEAKDLTISNVTVNRAVNDIVAKLNKVDGAKPKTSPEVA